MWHITSYEIFSFSTCLSPVSISSTDETAHLTTHSLYDRFRYFSIMKFTVVIVLFFSQQNVPNLFQRKFFFQCCYHIHGIHVTYSAMSRSFSSLSNRWMPWGVLSNFENDWRLSSSSHSFMKLRHFSPRTSHSGHGSNRLQFRIQVNPVSFESLKNDVSKSLLITRKWFPWTRNSTSIGPK